MKKPTLSILMPVFNGERYIRESIASILGQTYTDFELIIVNDGSTDDTASIVREFKDPRIRFIHRENNKGVVYSRNEVLDAARGDILAFFDADDLAHPDKFWLQIDFLQKHPGIAIVGTRAFRIGPEGDRLGSWPLHGHPEKIRARMLFHNAFVNSSVVFRNETLSGLRCTKGMAPCEDYLLWWQMMKQGQAHILNKTLTRYRVHPASLTGAFPDTLHSCDRIVTRMILEDAGLQPTEVELSTHLALKYGRRIVSVKELKTLRNWLVRLAREQIIVPGRIMRITLLNRWAKVVYLCRSNPILMLRAILEFGCWLYLTRKAKGE